MQALCEWDVQKEDRDASLAELFDALEATPDARVYARLMIRGFWADRRGVDGRISASAAHWSLDRISPVERNVMRVAIVEMLGGEIPPKVAIDEALEIAKEFGGVDSPRFVNGVLDAVFRKSELERGTSG